MKRRIILFVILALIFAGCGPKSVKLEYRLAKGDVSDYQMVMEMEGETRIEGMGQTKKSKLEGKQELELTQEVKEVLPDGILDVELTYTKATMEMSVDGKKAPSSSLEKLLVGKKISMRMDKQGKTLEAKGLEGLPGLPQGMDLENLTRQAQPVFPDKELKKGDSWIQDLGMNAQLAEGMYLDQSGEAKYTLLGFKKMKGYPCAEIKSVVNLTQSMDLTQEQIDPTTGQKTKVEMKVKNDGQGEGIIYYAYQDGKLIGSNMVMDMKSETTTTTATPFGEMLLKTDSDMTTKVNMELK